MDAEKFGAFISQCRKAKNMTQAELAALLQVTDKAVSRWERGKGFPDINLLLPLADALDLSVLELMRSEKMESEKTHLLDNETAADILADAVEMDKKNRRLDHALPWIVGIITVLAALLLKLSNRFNGSIGGALSEGFFVSLGIAGLLLFSLNREDRTSRKVYGIFMLAGFGISLFLLCLAGINPLLLMWGMFILMVIIVGIVSRKGA